MGQKADTEARAVKGRKRAGGSDFEFRPALVMPRIAAVRCEIANVANVRFAFNAGCAAENLRLPALNGIRL